MPVGPKAEGQTKIPYARQLAKRLAWFVGLWLAGVAVVFTLAYTIRLMIL